VPLVHVASSPRPLAARSGVANVDGTNVGSGVVRTTAQGHFPVSLRRVKSRPVGQSQSSWVGGRGALPAAGSTSSPPWGWKAASRSAPWTDAIDVTSGADCRFRPSRDHVTRGREVTLGLPVLDPPRSATTRWASRARPAPVTYRGGWSLCCNCVEELHSRAVRRVVPRTSCARDVRTSAACPHHRGLPRAAIARRA